jgi:chromosome segregation ATPase
MKSTQVEDQVREARARLKQARVSLSQAGEEARLYRADEPPPYQPEAAELAQSLTEIGSRYELARRQPCPYGQAAVPGADGIQKLRSYVADWRAGRQVRSLVKAIQPAVAAERQAKAGRAGDEINWTIRELQGAGLHGTEMDHAVEEAERLGGDLRQARDWLFLSGGTPGSRQATKEGTIQAWEALERIEAPLAQHAEQLKRWQTQMQGIGDKLGALQQAIDIAWTRLEEVPRSIDTSDLAGALEEAGDKAQRLARVASSLEVGQLAAFPDSVSPVIDEVNALASEAVEIGQWQEELDDALSHTLLLLNEIAARMLEMTQAFPYPIAWGSYEETLDRLFDEQAQISEVAAKRTRFRLRTDLDKAGVLTTKLQDLSKRVEQVCLHRKALIQLAGRPELGVRPAWYEQAAKTAGLTEEYAAENWPPQLAVRSIVDDAEGLRALGRQRVPASGSQPLPADGLGRLAGQIQDLVTQIEGFQERIAQVERVLAALFVEEQAAREALQSCQQAVQRLVNSLSGARPPLQAGAARQRQELEGLQRDGKRLVEEMEQRSTGQVEQKCGRVDRWVGSCSDAVLAVRNALGTELEQKKTELRREVDGLEGLGSFEQVGPMMEAKRLLAGRRPAAAPPAGRDRGSGVQRVVLVAGEASSLVEERGRCLAALEGVRSDIAEPLRRPRERWEKARQRATARGEEISTWKVAVESAWPPLECSIDRAEALLERARDYEASLGRSDTRSYSQELLGKIAECYEAALDEMEETETRVSQERAQIQEIASQIERWRGQLEVYGRAYPTAAQAIDSRIGEIDAGLGLLKKKWRRTPPSFGEARRSLQATWWDVRHDVEVIGSQPVRVRDIEAMSR